MQNFLFCQVLLDLELVVGNNLDLYQSILVFVVFSDFGICIKLHENHIFSLWSILVVEVCLKIVSSFLSK